jgi:hypothetical protein
VVDLLGVPQRSGIEKARQIRLNVELPTPGKSVTVVESAAGAPTGRGEIE